MGKKKKKKKSYIPDIIAYYGMNQHNNTIFYVDSDDVHKIAQQIFGTSYYIDFDTLSEAAIL